MSKEAIRNKRRNYRKKIQAQKRAYKAVPPGTKHRARKLEAFYKAARKQAAIGRAEVNPLDVFKAIAPMLRWVRK